MLVTRNLEEVLHLSQRVVILSGRPARVEKVEPPGALTRDALRGRLTLIRDTS